MMAPPGQPKTVSTPSPTRASQIACEPVRFMSTFHFTFEEKKAPATWWGAGAPASDRFQRQKGGPHPVARRPIEMMLRTRLDAAAAGQFALVVGRDMFAKSYSPPLGAVKQTFRAHANRGATAAAWLAGRG